LYFSPLSVTDDKQRDRKHPSLSSYSAGRAMGLFKVAGYFLYYILIARCWLLFIPYPITGLFDERCIFCGCVAVMGYFGSFWMSLLRESCRVCRSSPLVYPTGKLGCRGNYRTSKCTLRAGVMLCVCNYLVNRPPAVLCGPQGVNAAFYYVVETSLNTR
jgi:hypothetical protein